MFTMSAKKKMRRRGEGSFMARVSRKNERKETEQTKKKKKDVYVGRGRKMTAGGEEGRGGEEKRAVYQS